MPVHMPAEWTEQDWIWIGFPHDASLWLDDLVPAQEQIAAFANVVAESGQQAIDLMREESLISSVAAVLCDLEMPGMDGSAVIAHFRTHYPLIPIIVLSGATPNQFLDAVGQQGVGDWIRKPATNEAVLEKVRGAVHLYEVRQADRRAKNFPTP